MSDEKRKVRAHEKDLIGARIARGESLEKLLQEFDVPLRRLIGFVRYYEDCFFKDPSGYRRDPSLAEIFSILTRYKISPASIPDPQLRKQYEERLKRESSSDDDTNVGPGS